MRGTIHVIPSRDAPLDAGDHRRTGLPRESTPGGSTRIDAAIAHYRCTEGLERDFSRQALTGWAPAHPKQANEVLRDAGLYSDGQRGYHMVCRTPVRSA